MNNKYKYKKWLIAIISVFMVTPLAACSNSKTNKKGTSTSEVSISSTLISILPELPTGVIDVFIDQDDHLAIDIEDVTEDQYDSYLKDCINEGFTVEADKYDGLYRAYNDEGYYIDLSYYSSSSELSIYIDAPMELSAITWPKGEAGNQLPEPKATQGKFSRESATAFNVYIGETSKEDYNDYVNACADKGFIIDYVKYDNSYHAMNENGYELKLSYEGANVMHIQIEKLEDQEEIIVEPSATPTIESTPEPVVEESNLVDGMRPEFKQAMDDYEEFMQEYCNFMKKYSESDGSDLSLLADYATYLSKYSDMVDSFDDWDDGTMNDAETSYYLQVQSRVLQMLSEVSY